MPTLDPVGRAERPEDLDFDPVVIPIVGYTADHREVIHEAKFRGMEPTGAAMNLMRQTDAKGNVPASLVIQYLDRCLLKEDRDEFNAFIDDDDVYVDQKVLMEAYRQLVAYYSKRPTTRRPDSSPGPSQPVQTFAAAPTETVSTSSAAI
jgi:hypothetical protein